MRNPLLAFLPLAATLASTTACQKTAGSENDFENGPATIRGEWRLAVVGGGITGVMQPVPAGSDNRCVFGPDSTYTEYFNGKRTLTSTFYVANRPAYPGGPAVPMLAIKSNNSLPGQPFYRVQYITELTASKLNLTTGGGCAFNSEYVRTKAAGPATNP
ncbi:hypothetical protein [Hymenobacter cheonanensis]|uniref:hypothetical protein n=1 Tax=Hymenobacter sp. CA2-7 TaxID=3063993 RepID=UPI002712B55C|nr:hypothetical protein [Hymenobacter sp. CA2-7]MDO7887677.1 hypothetical protein [Hymenobacter sp. CA2-7]